MTAIPEVKCAGANIQGTVISTIVLGFAADPMARWAWPELIRISEDHASVRHGLWRPGIRA